MLYLTVFFAFLLGAVIGSFLNVVILRTHEKKSLGGRSHCPACKHQLSAVDLVPIISYLVQGGKCRYCAQKLSKQYPLVEVATAIAFVLLTYFNAYSIVVLLFGFFVTSVLIVSTVYDLRWGIIPDKIVLPASLFVIVYQLLVVSIVFLESPEISTIIPFFYNVLVAILTGLFFLSLILLTKGKGMGGGDLKLSFFIGLALGFPGTIIALLIAFLTGAIGAVILLIQGKKGFKSTVAFGPFLALGAYLALVLGNDIWTAYLKVLGF